MLSPCNLRAPRSPGNSAPACQGFLRMCAVVYRFRAIVPRAGHPDVARSSCNRQGAALMSHRKYLSDGVSHRLNRQS